jgi:hypothetical protein
MINRFGSNAIAAVLCAVLSGCVVTPVAYRPAPPPPAAPPAEPVAYTNDAQASEPPPPLPTYDQPPCPQAGYIWTPGYWHWGAAGYFWVPGTWVAPPAVGMLWTPGYWAMSGAVFVFHAGYWGPHVGYYGGVNYGSGYVGEGYHGARWVNNTVQYNTSVTNVNVTNVHNTYNETVVNNVTVNNTTVNRVSYAGGPGTRMQPNASELAATREAHFPATAVQEQHLTAARSNPDLAAAHNQGHPLIAATPRPGAFTGEGVTAAHPVASNYQPRPAQPHGNGGYQPYAGGNGGQQPHAGGNGGNGGNGGQQPYGGGASPRPAGQPPQPQSQPANQYHSGPTHVAPPPGQEKPQPPRGNDHEKSKPEHENER